MSKEIKISDILLRAAEVVISRDGDTSSSNGDFACVDIGSIIHLESEISKFFDLDGDYVIRSDLPLIKTRSEKYDRLVEENKNLKDKLESLEDDYKNEFNASEDLRCEKEDLAEENKRLREFCKSLQLDVSNEIKLEQLLSELGDE